MECFSSRLVGGPNVRHRYKPTSPALLKPAFYKSFWVGLIRKVPLLNPA
jgi:hypothetical protein